VQRFREAGAAFLAVLAGLLHGQPLAFNRADGLIDFFGGPGPDLPLLAIQQGQHFAVLFQFLAQGAD
jgi:hypothetical protein